MSSSCSKLHPYSDVRGTRYQVPFYALSVISTVQVQTIFQRPNHVVGLCSDDVSDITAGVSFAFK